MFSKLRFVSAAMAALFLASVSAQSPQPVGASLADRLTHISTFNSLDAADMRPWHIKIIYQTFDSEGKLMTQGTAEEWWASKDASRLVLAQSDSVETYVISNGHSFHSVPAGPIYSHVQKLLQLMLHPVNLTGIDTAGLTTRQQTLGTLKADCISLPNIVKAIHILSGKGVTGNSTPSSANTFSPTFCVSSDDVLRASLPSPRVSVAYNQVGRFQEHSTAVKVTVSNSDDTKTEGHIDQLTTVDATGIDLSTKGLTPASTDPVRVSAGVIAGQILSKAPLTYPESARSEHVSGSVVIHAIIGPDGKITSAISLSSPDPRLTAAALDSVKRWVYKPFLLNGVPTSVDTSITVNFFVQAPPSF